MSEPAKITQTDVLKALAGVRLPELPADLVTLRMVREIKICEGNVAFEIVVPGDAAPLKGRLEEASRAAVTAIPGVTLVNVRWGTGAPPPPAPAGAPAAAGARSPLQPPAPAAEGPLPGVRHVIAVGSGKGGVGKSTVAANLAVALAHEGDRVGLLDADVYGPSVPMMMGVREAPSHEEGKLVPLERHGVKLMSLGFLMPPDATHVIWRGPMVARAVHQMLLDCKWGELDYLLVDLPPGTGDAQLELAQTVPLTGAVVVMTSQDVAVSIASKAVGMFQTLKVPILGVVGNMDTFACPTCGTHTPIFTRGGSEEAARRLAVPFLGSIPLDPQTVEHGDQGTPTVVAAPDSAQAEAFRQVARSVAAQVREREAAGARKDPLGGLADRFRQGRVSG
jgi:ATP-binding protein involved in chromosome partitioning